MKWININQELPPTGKLVNIAYQNDNKKDLVTMGFYRHKHEEIADFDFDDDFDYLEEKDEYYFKEGWNSACLEAEYVYSISNVTDWQTLPIHPNKH